MPIYSPKALEREEFQDVLPLGTDRSIFGQLEERWRNLRAIRRFVLTPLTIIGSIFPFVYVAIWTNLKYFSLNPSMPQGNDAEWWLWVLAAILLGGVWFWVVWHPYRLLKKLEEEYDESLDALDALDYNNEFLVKHATGRRASQFNHLSPLTTIEMDNYGEKAKKHGPLTESMWNRWLGGQAPIRVCDLYTLEKMMLKEKWAAH